MRCRHHAHVDPSGARASVRHFETSDSLGERTGESAALMAKQLALEQAGGNGSAIHLDERSTAPGTEVMNGLRHQLFAGPGFALNENGGTGGRHHCNLFHDRCQERTCSNHSMVPRWLAGIIAESVPRHLYCSY